MPKSVTFYSEGVKLAGDLLLPADIKPGERRAGVVLCHGYTGVRSIYLPENAGVLAEAGYIVLSFDYKDWGDSDGRVERSLYERTNGYNYDAVKIFMPAGSKQPVVVHYTEHCPPDVGAAFIWLKNRDPEHWRDVQNVEHVMGKYIISDRPMTVEQWAAERATVIDDVVEELPAPESKQR